MILGSRPLGTIILLLTESFRRATLFFMHNISFTIYPNMTAYRGTVVTQPWAEWTKDLLDHDRRPTKDGPAAVFGVIPDNKNRAKKNVVECNAIGIDIEHKTEEQIETALATLEPFEYVIYTTYSHTDDDPRYRVVIPFSVRVHPSKWPEVWAAVNKFVGYINDPSTKDAGRLNFLPSCPSGTTPKAMHNGTGRFLSLTDLEGAATLEDINGRLRGFRGGELKKIADALRKGEAYAQEGERREKTLKITMWLANKARPLARAEFDELFGPSVAAMSWDLEEAWGCYDTGIEKVAGELPTGAEPTDEQLVNLAEIAKAHGKKSWTDLDWLLLGANAMHYTLALDGYYKGPVDRTQAAAFLARDLEGVPHIETTMWTDKGPRKKSSTQLTEEYGVQIKQVVLDMAAERSTFADGTFTEAACIQKKLEPEFNAEIDEWLQIFAGEHYDKICDWLASAPLLDRPLCALYLKGPAGCGKSLFATGLAQLWSDTAVELHNIFDNFNESLVRCPVVVAEEAVPRSWRGMPSTTRLRALITEPNRELLRKYRAPATMKGYIRLILTSNNDELLRSDIHTREDLAAIAQRFLMINAPEESSAYLLGCRDVDAWRREKLFAKHVLCLSENLPVEKDGRFWVEGNAEEMSLGLMVGSHWNSRVCQWLVSYLMQPGLVEAGLRGAIRRRDGELFVNERAMLEHWAQYFKGTREEPEVERIASALRTVSQGRGRVRRKYNGVVVQYHHINVDTLLLWTDRTGIGDQETILATLAEDSDDDKSWEEDA